MTQASTREFCRSVVALAGNLPAAVAGAARLALVRTLAGAAERSADPAVERVYAIASERAAPAVVSVPGRTNRLDEYHAALAIGVAAVAAGAEGTVHEGQPAFAAVMLSSVLPLAEQLDTSPDRLVAACALSLETQLRLSAALRARSDGAPPGGAGAAAGGAGAGWDDAGICGPIGAAVAAGVLLGLDEAALEQAVGIAASLTLGIAGDGGSAAREFQAGKAAANGQQAARLAAEGFTGSAGVWEAPRGLFRAMGAPPERAATVLNGLGQHWRLLDHRAPAPTGRAAPLERDASLSVPALLAAVSPEGVAR